MKKNQIPLFFSLLLLSIPGLVYGQQIDREPVVPGQESGGTNEFFACGASQYEIECSPFSAPGGGASNALRVFGTDNVDRIKIVCEGAVPHACKKTKSWVGWNFTLEVNPDRACPGATSVAVYAFGGNDRIDASETCDPVQIIEIDGGAGNDKIKGSNRGDQIQGGLGHDQILGLNGDDAIDGEDGNDKIDAGYGNDIISGGDGNDEIFADPDDWVSPYDTNVNLNENLDEVDGGRGDDCIFGIKSYDRLHGGEGNDQIAGGGSLYGDAGDDRLLISS